MGVILLRLIILCSMCPFKGDHQVVVLNAIDVAEAHIVKKIVLLGKQCAITARSVDISVPVVELVRFLP